MHKAKRTPKRASQTAAFILVLLTMILSSTACGPLRSLPAPQTTVERLNSLPQKNLPLQSEVKIYWNENQIPYIEANTDEDLALVLGLVHAHARLGQMELMKRVSQGRISEMAGPFTRDLDHSLRILDFGKVSDEIQKAMPASTVMWLEQYVAGINFYIENSDTLPHEYSVLGLNKEPWTVKDVITLSRLLSTDVNWLHWFNLIPLRAKPEWQEIWGRMLDSGGRSLPSFQPETPEGFLGESLLNLSKSGSNAFVVGGERTTNQQAFMASDPHVGFSIPNLWMLAGYKSPSFNSVGVMFPGIPVVLLGRNERIAWGATNMWSISSFLYDVQSEPEESFSSREERIKVRWWPDRKVKVRDSRFGPVISDIPFFKDYEGSPLALSWMGHLPSDELTALLNVNKAGSWEEFQHAFLDYSVSGQNYLYADVDGNIGQLLAANLPLNGGVFEDDFVFNTEEVKNSWIEFCNVTCLPSAYNPETGYLISTNNVPVERDPPVGHFFPSNDRFSRINELLMNEDKVDLEKVKEIQLDVYGSSAHQKAILFSSHIVNLDLEMPLEQATFVEVLNDWDGYYHEDSKGALAYELLSYYFIKSFYSGTLGEELAEVFLKSSVLQEALIDDLQKISVENREGFKNSLKVALVKATERYKRFSSWGDMHRMAVQHYIGRAPFIGRRYRFDEFGVPGGSRTVMKTANSRTDEKHNVTYGAVARYISDMSHPDKNYFVLMGGQDGWFNSENFLDQMNLWREGEYIKIPLNVETARRRFPHVTTLTP